VEESVAQEEVQRLRAQLYEMRSSQIDSILNLVTDHGKTLSTLSTDVAIVKERTETLSPLNDRMNVMERFQWKLLALAAAMGTLAAFLGWMFPRGRM
jgi:hypothetical protein